VLITFEILGLNPLQYLVINRFFRQANRIKNRRSLGATVTNNRDSRHTQEQTPSMFCMVDALLNPI
jgi:hypothetical protein